MTKRKQIYDALISSQEQYQELFENANDIIYTHDLAGTLTSLNKAAEVLTGYSRGEALGMNIATFLAPEYVAFSREMINRKIGGEPKTTYEIEIITKNSQEYLKSGGWEISAISRQVSALLRPQHA